jgi:ABC-2 type transport system permease protein
MNMMRLDPAQLWKRRAAAYRRYALPYLRYAAQSGLPLVLGFALIGFIHVYVTFLRQVPPSFPVHWLAVCVLTPLTAWTPVRTYLREADTVYLLPLESRMGPYWKQSMLHSLVPQWVALSIAMLLLHPIYIRAGEGGGNTLPFIWLILTLLKGANGWGGWMERRLEAEGRRIFYRFVRWSFCLLIVPALYRFAAWQTGLLVLLSLPAYYYAIRREKRYIVHWEHLIRLERQQQNRYDLFFNWFADVPSRVKSVRRREWAVRLVSQLPFLRRDAFSYLYGKTFVRSELFAIVLRLTFTGAALHWVLNHPWWRSVIAILFVAAVGIQMAALEREHRYNVWLDLYPLPQQQRIAAVQTIALTVHIACALVLIAPLFLLPVHAAGRGTALAGSALCIFWLSFVRYYRKHKRGKQGI